MKAKLLPYKFVLILTCLAMVSVLKAQTASTFADLQTQFATAVASGVPSTITLGAAITINANFDMTSTGDVITIVAPYSLSVASGSTFTIGNNVKINATVANAIAALAGSTVNVNTGCTISSTATSPLAAAGGNVNINGGTITTSNLPAVSAGSSLGSGGILTINGGYLASTATSTLTRGIVIDYNGTCIVNGGEIHADPSVSGWAISINSTNAGGKLYINGGTITATGTSGRAIQLDNNNSAAWIIGSPTITGGLEAIMAQKNGVVVLSGSPTLTGVIGTNTTTSKLYDCRNITSVSSTPGTGSYSSDQTVTLAGGGTVNKYVNTTSAFTTVTATLVYTTDGTTPVATSTAYVNPFVIPVLTMPTTLKVATLIETTIGTIASYTYTSLVTGINTPSQNEILINNIIINSIDLSNIEGFEEANLFNISGKMVFNGQSEKIIDASMLQKGIYILKIKTANGMILRKVIKK